MITELDFIKATGKVPENDDLERCNCPKAGQLGHWQCGWNLKENLPMFMSTKGYEKAESRF